MFIIRPIAEKDTADFIKIAFTAGIGMTSMPKNWDTLEKKVKESIEAFRDGSPLPYAETYLFVLEELETGKIGGTCGIVTKTGTKTPISFYQIKKNEECKGNEPLIKSVPTIDVVRYSNHWSEICSLYLNKDFRHSGLGRLLSLSRFLFIAAFSERFESRIFAEMRGFIDENHISPFWKGIGQHFVATTFENLMELRDEGTLDVSQALPQYPIYFDLLPKEVQESIGKIHPETKPALEMLIQEGFQLTNEFDICDGGPKIEIATKKIRSITESVVDTVSAITQETIDTHKYILSNNRLDFRACFSPVKKDPKGGIIIPQDTAQALMIRIGDTVRYVTPYKEPQA